MNFLRGSIFFYLIILCFHTEAQLCIIEKVSGDTIKLSRNTPEPEEATIALNNYVLDQISMGFVFLNFEDTSRDGKATYFKVRKGTRQSWREMKVINSEDSLPLTIGSLARLKKLVSEYNNNGYPFATVTLDTITQHNNKLTGEWNLRKGPLIRYDTVSVSPPQPVNRNYLQNELGIREGDRFAIKNYRSISDKMKRIPFYSLKSPVDISFSDSKAIVYLDLEERKTNSFEGVIGLNQTESGNVLTGFINLELLDILKSGKQAVFNWQRFDLASQEVNLKYVHPYILNSPVITELYFDLLKQDSSFLNRQFSLSLNTYVLARLKIGFEYLNQNSELLEGNLDAENVGFKVNNYQASISNVSPGPVRREWLFGWRLAGGLGERSLLQPGFADSIPLKSLSSSYMAEIETQIPVFRNASFFSDVTLAGRFNDNLLRNELLRVGGFKTFRGFNENQFFARDYFLHKFEARYFFESSSYLFVLNDLARIQTGLNKSVNADFFYSFGFGLTLNSPNGLFSIIFATGSQFGSGVSFSDTKVHFGYKSRF